MTIPYRSQWDPDATAIRLDCGPTCVAMVLESQGQKVPINEITDELTGGVNIGTTALDLQSSLEKRGISTAIWRGTTQPTTPAICLVKYSGFKRENVQDKNFFGWHWLILLTIGPDKVIVHDPDWSGTRRDEGANKVYSRAEWDAAFIPYDVSKIALVWSMKEPDVKEEEVTTGIVASDDTFLNIRSGPDTALYPVIGYFKNGTKVKIVGTARDARGRNWYKIPLVTAVEGAFSDKTLTQPFVANVQGWCAGWLIKIGTSPPPSPPPPPPVSIPWLGVNTIVSKQSAFDAADKGCRFFLGINMEDELEQIAEKYPDAVCINRRWIAGSIKPNGRQLADLIGGRSSKAWYETLNEYDNWSGGSEAELNQRIDVELEACDIMRAKGIKTVLGGFPMGCPDFTNPRICEIMKRYASRYNSDPGVAFSIHPYSPSMLRTDPTIPRPSIKGSTPLTTITTGPVGRNGVEATWEEPVQWLAAPKSPGPSIGGPMDEWFEGRWRHLIWKCGFDPRLAKIFGTEGGVDEGGIGGFSAHNATDEQFYAWCVAHQNYQKQPIVINGIPYPSPYRGTAIFDYSMLTNEQWKGFDITLKIPILQRRGWR